MYRYSDARAKRRKGIRTLGPNRTGGGKMLLLLFDRFLFDTVLFVSVGTIILVGVFLLVVVVVALGI
jgi:hypothetical protein